MTLAVKLYEKDGSTFVRAIPATQVSVECDRRRSIRRTAQFWAPGQYLGDLRVLGRRVKVSDTSSGVGAATSPTFSRPSPAYLSDGTQVASGQPRYEPGKFGQVWMVEGGTTNLLTANQASVETDTSGFNANGSTMTRDVTEKWHGSASLKVTTAGTVGGEGVYAAVAVAANTIYSGSVRVKAPSGARLQMQLTDLIDLAKQVKFIATGDWQRVTVEGHTTDAHTTLYLLVATEDPGTPQAVTFYIDGLQIEQKPYATSFTDSTRSPETLTIPTAGVLNPSEGTLELVVKPNYSSSVAPPGGAFDGFYDFCWGSPGTTGFMLVRKHLSGNPNTIRLEYWNGGTIRIDYTSAYNAGDNLSVAVRWSATGVALLVNGAVIGSHAAPLVAPAETVAYLGQRPGYGYGDALYDDLRISSILRTDAEILAGVQSNAPLPVDANTTCKLSADGHLKAEAWVTTETQVFDGYIDEVALRSTPGETSCNVTCRDKAKKLKLVRWTDDKTYEDTTATETANLLTSVTASTNLGAGGQIQSQAAVYSKKLYATVLGIEKEVTPSSESGDIIAGTYQADYSETGLTNLRLVAYLDLKIAENLQSVAATTNGTATVDMSSDGQAWSAFAAGTARYLRITVNKSAGPVTLGVTVTTATNHVPGNVLVDDSTSWRPTTADLDRTITGDAGSSQTANVLTAKLGVNELDPNARYKVKVERSADNITWTEITTVASAGRSLEVVFAPVAARYWRLTFLSKKDAPPAVRFLSVRNVTVDAAKKVYLSDIIQDIATGEGETLFRITPTRTYVKAVTFERGKDKWESIQKLAQEHGWEAFYDRDGYLVARPVDVDPWKDLPIYKSNLSFDATFSDAEIYNQILAENGDPKTPLTSTKTNDNAWSVTSTVNLGNRASPVVKAPLADTQAKLDAFALAELEKASRQTHSARLTHIADGKYPAATLEAGDVIQAEDAQSGISDTYVLESFRLEDRPDSAEYDFAAEVSEL